MNEDEMALAEVCHTDSCDHIAALREALFDICVSDGEYGHMEAVGKAADMLGLVWYEPKSEPGRYVTQGPALEPLA